MSESKRWSDEKIEEFHAEFRHHMVVEEQEREQQQEMYDALFQKEDRDSNTPAGLVQAMGRLSADIRDMKIAQDRQKTFIGGVMFAFTAMGFFFTDSAHKVFAWLKTI